MATNPGAQLAHFDKRPFFEQVLAHGRAQGLIDDERLAGIRREGAKGIVQLAGFFSTAHLRPELEAARIRLVTLVSLALAMGSGGELSVATDLLRHKTLLSLSKAGADALRSLLGLPQDLWLEPPVPIAQFEKPMLSFWTLDQPMTLERFLTEKAQREHILAQHELCYWLAGRLGVSRQHLQMHESCESVINSAMLLLFVDKAPRAFFSPNQFMKLHAAAAKRRKHDFPALSAWLAAAPAALRPLLEAARQHFIDTVLPALKTTPAQAFVHGVDSGPSSSVFYFEAGGLDELAHHDQEQEALWRRLTGGKSTDPYVLNTLLLTVAAGMEPRPSLRKKDALELQARYRQDGPNDEGVLRFIQQIAPFQIQSDLTHLWQDDLGPEARDHLDDDDPDRVLSYLFDTCVVSFKKPAR